MRFVSSLALAALLTVSASVASASTLSYDAASDFSTASNANGVWTYGYGTTGAYSTGTGFTAFTDSGSSWQGSGWAYWEISNGILPAVGFNTPGTNPGAGGLTTVSVPQTELWLHPGPAASGQDTIVLFTATVSGTYNLSAAFTGRSSQGVGNGTNVSIYINGVLLGSDYLTGAYGDTYGYNGSIVLSAGDVVSFDLNNSGDYGSDSTGLRASLSTNVGSTPEPASITLLGTGLLTVGSLVRRKIRR